MRDRVNFIIKTLAKVDHRVAAGPRDLFRAGGGALIRIKGLVALIDLIKPHG